MAKKVLIVGGVAGGASAAARLRRLDETAEIVMFERGDYISFANCGLPYHIGGTIDNRNDLLLQTPESLKKRFNVEVRTRNEVVGIDRKTKQVEVIDLTSGNKYFEKYDKLVLSPGAEPTRPPIDGIESDRIFTLRSVSDTDRINEFIGSHQPKRAVVVGGGYIGLEMAENLRDRGMLVAAVEMLDQVLPPMDKEMADLLHGQLHQHNVALWLDDAVASFQKSDERLTVCLKSGMQLSCDFAILAIGVRPEIKLARDAGLDIGPCGGIKVASSLQTGDPDIYAIGDAIEVKDFVLDVRTAGEFNRANVPASVNIPVDELRKRLDELPKDVTIDAYCGVGIRSYIACRILTQNGFSARNISGGFITYCSYANKGLSEDQTAQQLKEEFCLV